MPRLMILFTILLTVGAYLLSKALYLRYRHPLLNIVLLGAALVIATLLALNIPYQAYLPGRRIMTSLLGPATVGLAVPLYRQRSLVRRHAPAIVAGVGLGSLASMLVAGLIALMAGLPREVVLSVLPKSVTIPFAVEIARIHGGSPGLASAFVVATGTLGSVFGATLLTWAGIRHPVARGLALGTGAHGQGTAMAFMEGEREGSMAGLAMTLAGITTATLAPLMVRLLLRS
ncbi:LrgB family protein [Geothrix oryzisoli]|uniref:LrgB family protein n=1 Tax=Geothrix oryzisoli TaxID=2922721 RepID=UPI001FABB5D8|nr:LrgB family protein [Geothrix oryzisoli]